MGNKIRLVQGSEDWINFKRPRYGSSEAAAMLGLSTKVKRNELVRMKATGTAQEFSEWVRENILEKGHEVEALARPIAEEKIDDDLFPDVYGSEEIVTYLDKIMASSDGLTADRSINWECKQFNAALFKSIQGGELPEEYMPQPQQIMMETGAKRTLFTCTDGTRECWAQIWIEADEVWFDRIRKGWAQFDLDVANYQHVEVLPPVAAAPIIALPALSIKVEGSIALQSNLTLFGEKLRHFIDGLDKSPSTDQAFADAEAAVKVFKNAEDALEAAEANALAQTASVDEMRRTVALYKDLARSNRLALEKIVKARKETIRIEIAQESKAKFAEHIEALNKRLGRPYMPTIGADFVGAMKGLKTISSIRNAVDTELARAKIEANEIADKLQANLETLRTLADDHKFLFADVTTIIHKANDDLVALIQARIAIHDKEEADKAAALRARIEAEERAKAEAAAAETLRLELAAEDERRRQADSAARAQADTAAAETQDVLTPAQDQRTADKAVKPWPVTSQSSLIPESAPACAPVDGEATLNLGQINERLAGVSIDAKFLERKGFIPRQEKNAKLYRAADLPKIFAAIIHHIEAQALEPFKAAA